MAPEDIKAKIHAAYTQAINNRALQRFHSSNLTDLLRDLKLYGKDAGADFIETHLTRIVGEAVECAGCKSPALEISVYGCGRAAIDAMAASLREATAMSVDVKGSVIRLVWADTSPRLM